MTKVLMLIKTSGLEYDDRLRKEVLSLKAIGAAVEIIALDDSNRASAGTVYGDVPFRTIRLRSRRWAPQGAGLAVKTSELYGHFMLRVLQTRPDVVWIHNLELAAIVPPLAAARAAGLIDRIIWDQHELPAEARLKNPRMRSAYTRFFNMCNSVVMANRERYDYLVQQCGLQLQAPVTVLRNLPDTVFAELARVALPVSVTEWLAGRSYFLAQGGANPYRALDELVAATLTLHDARLIVVGPYRPTDLERLESRYGTILHERVLFAGFVRQLELTPYIDNALASIVLYQAIDTNNLLCAPNRMYQAIARGTPLVVGMNPPMKQVVEQYRNGIVLETDGSDSAIIAIGLRTFLQQQPELRRQAAAHQHDLSWESQNEAIARLLL